MYFTLVYLNTENMYVSYVENYARLETWILNLESQDLRTENG